MSDTSDENVNQPAVETPTPTPPESTPAPEAVQPPTAVVSGVDEQTPASPISTPPEAVQETTGGDLKPVGEEKIGVPYSFVLCPKCGAEVKEEYFFANKKSSIGGQGKELGFTARTEETGDRVFLISDKKRYWVKNPESLTKLGFNLGQEKNIPFAELLQCPEYEPIDLTVPGSEFPRKDEVSPEEKKKAESGKPYKIWA